MIFVGLLFALGIYALVIYTAIKRPIRNLPLVQVIVCPWVYIFRRSIEFPLVITNKDSMKSIFIGVFLTPIFLIIVLFEKRKNRVHFIIENV